MLQLYGRLYNPCVIIGPVSVACVFAQYNVWMLPLIKKVLLLWQHVAVMSTCSK